jgi:anti-sigma factor ChrR (cupin superfamily)
MPEQSPGHPAQSARDAPSAADEEDALDAALIGAIGAAFAPVEPTAARRAALRDRILARTGASAPLTPKIPARASHSVTIRARDGGWIDFAPGIHAKLLFTDGRAETYLARLDPGTVLPPHSHPGIEECLVLEGRVEFSDGGYLDAGDYQAYFERTSHGETRSPGGALLFLRYSEPLARYLSL